MLKNNQINYTAIKNDIQKVKNTAKYPFTIKFLIIRTKSAY